MVSLRAHSSLVAGVALPLLLAAWYFATVFLPRLAIPAPQHDLIFLTNYAGDSVNALRMEIRDGHAIATFVGENFGYGWPRLYRFTPATGQLAELSIPRPPGLPQKPPYNRPAPPESEEPRHVVPVPALESLRLTGSLTAPDGYTFTPGASAGDSYALWESQGRGAMISKGGVEVAVPLPEAKGPGTITFLGWVVP